MSAARSVVSSAKLIAVCTLLSRVTGLARDILLVRVFALSYVQDAFNYAFAFPNFFRRLFGEGGLTPVFVPTFTQTLEREGREAAWRVLAQTLALLTTTLLTLCAAIELVLAALWLAAPPAPSPDVEARRLVLGLTGVMAPFMVSICVLALLSSILNCLGSFVPAALAPVLLNVCMLAALLGGPALGFGSPQSHVFLVAASVLAAGLLQLAFLYPALRRHGVRLGWRLETRDPAVRQMLVRLPPVILGQSVLALGVLLDVQLCWMFSHRDGAPSQVHWLGWTFTYPLQEGALSAVTVAQRLYQFPLGVLVISIATAALPAFSRLAAREDWSAWASEVRQSLRLAVFEGLMAGSVMLVAAEPIVRFLFQYGDFGPESTQRTQRVLAWYGVAMWAFCAQHIVTRGFYSLGDVRTPLVIGCVLLPANLLLSFLLLWVDAIRESAFAISACVTSSLAVVAGLQLLRRRVPIALFTRSLLLALLRMLLAAVVTAGVVSAVRWNISFEALRPALGSLLAARGLETLVLLAAGVGTFLLTAAALRLSEPRQLLPRRRA
ncbi:Lipid II flippase MurJ [Phycisphaerae bacterium RAS1]|nr:Lipid II flippase MurJ [Phycisphaerae bacterium RAS1]